MKMVLVISSCLASCNDHFFIHNLIKLWFATQKYFWVVPTHIFKQLNIRKFVNGDVLIEYFFFLLKDINFHFPLALLSLSHGLESPLAQSLRALMISNRKLLSFLPTLRDEGEVNRNPWRNFIRANDSFYSLYGRVLPAILFGWGNPKILSAIIWQFKLF